MESRKLLVIATIVCLLVGGLGVWLYMQQRIAGCAYVPYLAENLLPNADLSQPGSVEGMPAGWSSAAPGVRLGEFAVDGDQRALQLMGIANYVQTPPVMVQPGRSYCFHGLAISDSEQDSATRLRVSFHWLDAAEQELAVDSTLWQPVVLWQPEAPPDGWSPITAAFRAPADARTLLVRIQPASDDRVYLDAFHLRPGGSARLRNELVDANPPIQIKPWPAGYQAAVSFSFDWETAMGGLIHSRSVDDPYASEDPLLRGMRMREGITTTLELFQPYGVRATYYATGYNFLLGNPTRIQFMDDPTYAWASRANRWASDRWQTTPWFGLDPYGTVASHPAWYFGDLVPQLVQAGHDIQSHTFSHFYGGLVGARDWQVDIATWNRVAAERGVPPMRSLAFPWSSSAGMSDASWEVLEAAGITSVTRLSDQSQYNLFATDAQGLVIMPQCRPLPGHAYILACPDFYLTPERSALAIDQIRHTVEAGGMIDLWAHTEEVVTTEQLAAWEQVVGYAAADKTIWIAPLREIADWQQAREQVQVQIVDMADQQEDMSVRFTLTNTSNHDLTDLAVTLPFSPERMLVHGDETRPAAGDEVVLDIAAGQTIEVVVWPAL